MKPIEGICPECEAEGIAGNTCDDRVCQRKGYHCIPVEDFNRLRARTGPSRDSNMGLAIGEHLLAGELGEGGFGKVYLALQLPLMMRCALKLMTRNRADDPLVAKSLLRKFEGEALSLARLNHPNIVRLLKYGSHEGVPYLVMEYVEARTLKQEVVDRALRGEGFNQDLVQRIVGQLLNAIECAHELNIVHRDLKPENVMLQRVTGDSHFVRVLDFGLAKFLEDGQETSVVLGTPVYMAPEQLDRNRIGPWTDIYAVGVIAFELMTGRRPFPGKTTKEILSQKLDPAFDPLARASDLDMPDFAMAFFRKAIARDTGDRFQCVREFREAFAGVFKGMETTRALELSRGDLTGLLDSTDLSRLHAEKDAILEEKKRLDEERQRLDEERRRLESLKHEATSEAGGASRSTFLFAGIGVVVAIGLIAVTLLVSGNSAKPEADPAGREGPALDAAMSDQARVTAGPAGEIGEAKYESRKVVINPVIERAGGREIVAGVRVKVDGALAGVSGKDSGVPYTFDSRVGEHVIEVEGKDISPSRRRVLFSDLKDGALYLTVSLIW